MPIEKPGTSEVSGRVETNFLPGRTFDSLEDLNRQAFEWATDRMDHRPVSKTGLIPAKAFEHERHYLTELSPHLPRTLPSRTNGARINTATRRVSPATTTGCRAANGTKSNCWSTPTI